MWRKSSRSTGNGGNCVEIARTRVAIGLRDSKDPDGPVLAIDAAHFTSFLAALKRDALTGHSTIDLS
jgi:hypothetical protein